MPGELRLGSLCCLQQHTSVGQSNPYEPRHEKTCFFAYAKTKEQISCAVTAQLISAFVFAT